MKVLPLKLMRVAALLLAGIALDAGAQAYPNRNITFIWPFNVGTPNGEAFRVLADEAGKILGRPMVTEFRGGAGTRLGVQALLKAQPDGYLLAAGLGGTYVVTPLASPTFRLEPGRDYTPIMIATEAYSSLTSHPGLPFRDLKGLIAYAKANPGKLTFGSPGVGSDSHLHVERLMAATGIQMTHIPYKGSAAALPDRLNGTISMYMGGLDAAPLVNSGQLIAIATTGPSRASTFPNTPTLDESGAPGLVLKAWTGISAPPGTSPEIVARLNAAFTEAFKIPLVIKAMDVGGWAVTPSTPEAMTARIKSEFEIFRPLVRRLNLNFD